MLKLWKHQQYAIEKYASREYFGLIFPCGCGKSLAAARIAELKDRPVIIIAPNCLCSQWKKELENHGDNRITEKDWNVVMCTSSERKTKRFLKAFNALKERVGGR